MGFYPGHFVNLITSNSEGRNYQVGDLSTLKVGDKVFYGTPYFESVPLIKSKVTEIDGNRIIIKIGRRIYKTSCDKDTGNELADRAYCIFKTREDYEQSLEKCQADIKSGRMTKEDIDGVIDLFFGHFSISTNARRIIADAVYKCYNEEVKNFAKKAKNPNDFSYLLGNVMVKCLEEKILA